MSRIAKERMLEIKDLKVHFDTEDGVLHAVDGVSFGIDAGETLGVVGESGCGKSVTAKTITRLLDMPPGRIVGGEIRWTGNDLIKANDEAIRALRAREIAMIFQEPMTSLNPVYSVGEQIATHNAPRRHVEEASDRLRGNAFAATGFTSHAQRFARVNAEAHPVDRVQYAILGVEMHLEVFDFEHALFGYCAHPNTRRGSSASRKPSPM